MASIATRTGDHGETGLLFGQRVPKDHPQIEALGVFDELNAALGLAKATTENAATRASLTGFQRDLVALMGEIACAQSDIDRYLASSFARVDEAVLARLDATVADIEARQPRFDGWATPGANLHSAALETARTIARRGERRLVGLAAHGRTLRPLVLQIVNRLADALWLMAREAEGGTKSG